MRKLLQAAGIALVLGSVWYGIWSSMMADEVARVKASIAYQYKHLREHNQKTSFEADEVFATGFPFSFQVGVKRATLSMVDASETFAVSIPMLTLESIDAAQGTYRVHLPRTVEALYAKDGQAPEHYTVTADAMPTIKLISVDFSNSNSSCMVSGNCIATTDAPIVSYKLAFPTSIALHMTLGDKAEDAKFNTMLYSVSGYTPIPGDLSGPLQLFVGVLREALVFNGK